MKSLFSVPVIDQSLCWFCFHRC